MSDPTVPVTRHPTVNIGVLREAFTEALQADLSVQYDGEEMDRWLSEGGAATRNGSPILATQWIALRDAVSVFTRQMRRHGYYPEQVLVAIKSAVRNAALTLVSGPVADVAIREASQACIRTYFEPWTDKTIPASASRLPVAVPPGAATPGQRPALYSEVT